MCASIGMNVARDGSSDLDLVRNLGCTWVRIVAMPDVDLTTYFGHARALGLQILLVLARESGGDYVAYRQRYGAQVAAIQVGNEPDLDSPSSWTMTPAELVALGKSVRGIFPTTPLVTAGMASGHPEWLNGVDLSWADAVACLVPDQRVTARNPTLATMRQYDGDVVTIETATGNKVTCTPNHPILTRQGWLPASQVKEGSEVAQNTIGPAQDGAVTGPNDVQVPTRIADVFRAVNVGRSPQVVPGLPLDFHGDGRYADVHVIATDGLLGDTFAQHFKHRSLVPALSVRPALAGRRHQGLKTGTFAGATESGRLGLTTRAQAIPMSLEQRVNPAFLDAETVGYRAARFARRVPLVQSRDSRGGPVQLSPARTDGESPLLEFLRQCGMAYPGSPSENFEAIPAGIAFIKVSHVSVSEFHGTVYNLSTEDQVIVADGIITHNCHPYLKDAPNPTDLEDLPDVTGLIDGYRALGKPVLVTEWGWWGGDEARGAEEVGDMTAWAAKTADVEVYFHFCLADTMVPPFGLYRSDGSAKPAAGTFISGAARAIQSLWPAVHPEPQPEPAGPDPWQWFTAEQIASVGRCPIDAIQENWPRLVGQLALCGINDRPTQVAMIGTVAIESAHTFRPVREAFYLGEPEPAESWRRANLRYYPYYGRGFIQNTWESNYAILGPKIAQLWGAGLDDPTFDLVANPDNLLDPDMSSAAGAIYFRDHGGDGLGLIPQAARAGDWREVRRLVQGGTDGLSELVAIANGLAPVQPQPAPTDKDALIAAYETALRTLRDETLPAALDANARTAAQLAEAARIVEQFVGPRPA